MLKNTFTISYHLLFVFFFFSGISILVRNPKNKNNVIYFLLCISFAIWTEAIGLCNATINYKLAIFWRRVAAIGWGSSFTFVLHFFLVYSGYHRLFKKKSVYLIYIPVILNWFIFAFYTPFTNGEYALILTELGWVNLETFSGFDLYFRIYYSVNIALSLVIMFFIFKRSRKENLKKLLILNIFLIIILVLITNFYDLVLKKNYGVLIPSIEPFYLLIGLVSIRAFIAKHKPISFTDDHDNNQELILTPKLRYGFYRSIGIIFYLVSGFIFFTLMEEPDNIHTVMITSVIFIVIGTLIHFTPRMIKNKNTQDSILVLIMSASILQMLFRGDVKPRLDFLWILPIIYLIITTVFESKRLSVIIFLTGVIFETVLAYRYPIVNIEVNMVGHIARLAFYCTAFFLHSYVRDVFIKRKTELETANKELSLSEKIINQTADGVCITDLNARIIRVNDSFCRSTHFSREELIGKHISIIRSGVHNKMFYKKLWLLFNRNSIWTGEFWYKNKLGNAVPSWLSINILKNDEGDATNYIGIFSDISKLKKSEERVKELAYYDSLTGLPNRFHCHEIMKKGLEQIEVENGHLSIMFLDLDAFKGVNDNFGHSKGDLILIETAKRLKTVVKNSDTVARLGGDEFVIILQDTDEHYTPEIVAEKIIHEIAEPFFLDQMEVFLGVSIGIVEAPLDSLDIEELLMKADSAMYRAKELGKNTYCYYSKEIQDKNLENLKMESKIKKGLSNNQFELHIQPKIRVTNGVKSIFGGEALIRLHDESNKLISPAQFIKIAEERGLIVPLGYWVINEACKMIKKLNTCGIELNLAINVSAKQFDDINFVSTITDAVEYHNIKPEQLEIEITESIFKSNMDEITVMLEKIRNFGVKISIDDFGTGYSSLNLLGTLPIDCLKIDKSFTAKLGVEDEKEFVSTIIDLADNLSLETVVEGVETKEQVDILSKNNDDILLQGYFFSKPVPFNDFVEFYKSPDGLE